MKRNVTRSALIAAVVLVLATGAASATSDAAAVGVLGTGIGASGIPMQWVPHGTFTLGEELGTAGSGNVSNLTDVTLTQGFWMGRYPVTRQQWVAVMTGNPNGIDVPHLSWSDAAPNAQESAAAGGFNIDRRPVTHVSWYDAIVFANRLSIMRGLAPAYEIECGDNGELTSNTDRWGNVPATKTRYGRWNNVQIVPGSDGYRLPTEAQWEFAAKGGVTGETFTFSGSDNPASVAWIWENSASSPRMVGLLAANGLGLHDMSGNVWEWVQDWHGTYPGTPQVDWTGAASGFFRVFRGGGWGSSTGDARSVERFWDFPNYRFYGVGFRLVRP